MKRRRRRFCLSTLSPAYLERIDQALGECVRLLDPLSSDVIMLRYGFCGFEPMTKERVAMRMEIPVLAVRQLEIHAFQILKHSEPAEELCLLLGQPYDRSYGIEDDPPPYRRGRKIPLFLGESPHFLIDVSLSEQDEI